jgi:hypothetical protein
MMSINSPPVATPFVRFKSHSFSRDTAGTVAPVQIIISRRIIVDEKPRLGRQPKISGPDASAETFRQTHHQLLAAIILNNLRTFTTL